MNKKEKINPLAIKPMIGDRFIDLRSDWDSLEILKICSLENKVGYRKFSDFLDREDEKFISNAEMQYVFIKPSDITMKARCEIAFKMYRHILDLASSHLRDAGLIEVDKIIDILLEDDVLKRVGRSFIIGCLKCYVASGSLVIKFDRRKKERAYMVELSQHRKDVEKIRVFAASFAGELTSLSDRVRTIIEHKSTVGTYRENLFQTLLRKHIPERYHVATGFIHGCDRQIDIIIYDRLEYAPLFREGDLVVVLPESVRAVIEVKTNLTKQQLVSSLKQIEEVSGCDDFRPPFFKGIFGFESDLEPEDIFKGVSDFYTYEIGTSDEDDVLDDHRIMEPYAHLTSLCVLRRAYCQVEMFRNNEKNRYIPTLFSLTSATGLQAEAAHFFESPLIH